MPRGKPRADLITDTQGFVMVIGIQLFGAYYWHQRGTGTGNKKQKISSILPDGGVVGACLYCGVYKFLN